MSSSKEIPAQLLVELRKALDRGGMTQLFREWKREFGTVSPVLDHPPDAPCRTVPHPVHFREGMAVRNFMRKSGLCEGWTDHDFDGLWARAVELAIEVEHAG